ncbi:hypothetical protein [Rubinisphaera margarita]|uniref:hypothetical protein n=1 Tax=Rubinisphaera margarita TaxID=2909586 RepID=UPI001EE8FFC1|nr:hypothetical protein [Rubinisphaera margarita]MCG6157097.1 hypothetical protein [Rubinisphaera margarita]
MATVFGSQEQILDRRSSDRDNEYNGPDRRQFGDSREHARPEVAELANAVDQYKLRHRRRFVTYDELYAVIRELGYVRPE